MCRVLYGRRGTRCTWPELDMGIWSINDLFAISFRVNTLLNHPIRVCIGIRYKLKHFMDKELMWLTSVSLKLSIKFNNNYIVCRFLTRLAVLLLGQTTSPILFFFFGRSEVVSKQDNPRDFRRWVELEFSTQIYCAIARKYRFTK